MNTIIINTDRQHENIFNLNLNKNSVKVESRTLSLSEANERPGETGLRNIAMAAIIQPVPSLSWVPRGQESQADSPGLYFKQHFFNDIYEYFDVDVH